jgi:hypothetical protein
MKAFFPHQQAHTDLRVLPLTFSPQRKAVTHNDFMHVLGHTLGLKHEFAVYSPNWFIEKVVEATGRAKSFEFGTPNPKSVMSYEDPPTLQQSDIENAKALLQTVQWFQTWGSRWLSHHGFPTGA